MRPEQQTKNMFRFQNPEYFYLMGILPAMVLIYIWSAWRANRRSRLFGDKELVERMTKNRSRVRPHIKFGLLLLALAAIITALARPQLGLSKETEQKNGIEVAVMLDVSNSMLARDVSPNRLERAKMLVSNLVDKMQNDKVAFGIFAGEAYPQLPITQDYASVKMLLNALNTDAVTLQGTNIAAAIELASRSFTDNKQVGKAILLITDGEGHEGGAEEAAKEAAKDGRKIYVLGIGSTSGTEIPTSEGYMTDRDGNVVRTALNEQMCREVAKAGDGIYIHIDNSNIAQKKLAAELDQLQKVSSSTSYDTYDEQFRAFALIALLILVIEFYIFEAQNPFFNRFKLFKKPRRRSSGNSCTKATAPSATISSTRPPTFTAPP